MDVYIDKPPIPGHTSKKEHDLEAKMPYRVQANQPNAEPPKTHRICEHHTLSDQEENPCFLESAMFNQTSPHGDADLQMMEMPCQRPGIKCSYLSFSSSMPQ